jgi:DivIVA domain-containing protein
VTLLLLLLILGVLGLVIAVAAGSISGGLGDAAKSTPDPAPRDGPVTARDLEQVRFAPALRGYRIDQVEALLDRLRDQLAQGEAGQREAEQRAAQPPAVEQPPADLAPADQAPADLAPADLAPADQPAGPVNG